jgi:hypothetical protein
MIAGIEPTKRQKHHDRIARTRLPIASSSVRGADNVVADGAGEGGIVWSAIAPFYVEV